jgi:hypothetical protein
MRCFLVPIKPTPTRVESFRDDSGFVKIPVDIDTNVPQSALIYQKHSNSNCFGRTSSLILLQNCQHHSKGLYSTYTSRKRPKSTITACRHMDASNTTGLSGATLSIESNNRLQGQFLCVLYHSKVFPMPFCISFCYGIVQRTCSKNSVVLNSCPEKHVRFPEMRDQVSCYCLCCFR